jgi:hypothetical protein
VDVKLTTRLGELLITLFHPLRLEHEIKTVEGMLIEPEADDWKLRSSLSHSSIDFPLPRPSLYES